MSFGKRLVEIATQLDTLDAKRVELIAELHGLLPGLPGPSGPAPSKPGKIVGAKVAGAKPAKRKTPGDLQPLVLKVLGSYRSHKTLDELYAKILKTRPNTKKAAVGAVLAGLSLRGKVLRQDNSFYLPTDLTDVPVQAPGPTSPAAARPAVQEAPRVAPVTPEVLED